MKVARYDDGTERPIVGWDGDHPVVPDERSCVIATRKFPLVRADTFSGYDKIRILLVI